MKWNWKRPVAFLLSFAMMAGSLQGALSLPVSAAEAKVTVYFVDDDGSNPNMSATRMIGAQGQASAKMKIEVAAGMDASDYYIKKVDVNPAEAVNENKKQYINFDQNSQSIIISSDASPEAGKEDTYKIALTLALLANGGITNERYTPAPTPTPPTPDPDGGTTISDSNDEETTIGYSKNETNLAESPELNTYLADAISVNGTFEIKNRDITVDAQSSFVFDVTSNDNGKLGFTVIGGKGLGAFEPYDEVAIDMNGGVVDNGDGTTTINISLTSKSGTANNLGIALKSYQQKEDIVVGTRFTLSIEQPTSPDLTLILKNPQTFVNEIAESFMDDANLDSFIEFFGTNKKEYITDDFQLLHRTPIPGLPASEAVIEWRWFPDPDTSIPEQAGDDGKKYVSIPNNDYTGNWYTASVTQPEQYDYKGRLCAIVRYTSVGGETVSSGTWGENGIEDIPGNIKAEIPIVIKKRGTSPEVTYDEAWVKAPSNGSADKVINEKLPNTISMDCNQNQFEEFPKGNDYPYQFKGHITNGSGTRSCDYVIVKSSEPDVITMRYTKDLVDYDLASGKQISFKVTQDDDFRDSIEYYIYAKPNGKKDIRSTQLTFSFYRNGSTEPFEEYKTSVSVRDTSPSTDTTLKDMEIRQYRSGNLFENVILDWTGQSAVDWEFIPEQKTYSLHFGYKTEKIVFKPFINQPDQKVYVSYTDPVTGVAVNEKEMKDQDKTDQINLGDFGVKTSIKFKVVSESGVEDTYIFEVQRKNASEDATLSELHIFDSADAEAVDLMNPAFGNANEYTIKVPYMTDKVLVKVVPTDRIGAEIEFIQPDLEGEDSKTSTSTDQWVPLVCELQDGLVVNNLTPIKIRVIAENGVDKKEYTVNVIREAPQHNTDLAGLKITNVAAEEEAEGSGDLTASLKPAFATGKKEYSLTLDYGVEKINFAATLDPQYNSTMQLMSDNKRLEVLSTEKPSKTLTIKPGATVTYVIRVTAEDGSTMSDYSITVTRTAPSTDATLSGIDIIDTTGAGNAAGGGGAAGGTRLGVDNFLAETKKYTVTVDYVVTSVDVSAKVVDPKASKLTINGKNIDLGTGAGGAAGGTATTSANVKLDYPNTTITIIATAEDGVTTSKYVVTVKRNPPSDDARLASLKVDPGTLSPLFVPSKTEYTATIEADDNRVSITAVPTEPHATMTIDGNELKSGEAYSLELVEVNQTVTIVVTAQDGKSQKTYTIRFTNKNLIKKSANADLKSLKLTKGEMSPVFKPSTLDYSFYTTEDTSYVDLYPVPSDPNATVRVMSGTLQIGDHNGNYSQTIVDGENEFTIEVTASDGVTIKTYTAMVYRNDEENMGSLTPLTIEDIDLEAESPIISSDITKRPRVSSEVFQELKNYPDKTLVLQGNDYSLQFAAKDLNTIIPDAVNYNFGMKFSSDSEAEIMDEINSYSGNQGLTPIFVEFNYHGELPGKATYTLSLGKQYANQKLYFHYYNEERGRIDYYGYITTNSQGTFSVPLSRLGTFIITPRRIAGSENKALVSTAAGSTANGNAASEEGVNLGNTEQVRNSKINPDTGFRAK